MKVYVWTGGHTIAETLVTHPPENVTITSNLHEYVRGTGIAGERVYLMPNHAKKILDELVYRIGVPRVLPRAPEGDVIHTVSGLVPITRRPWVTTISMPSSFFGLRDDWSQSSCRRRALRSILRMSNCRRVMCFSQSTLEGLRFALGPSVDETIESKMEVLYPAIDPTQFVRKEKDRDEFRILFVGNHFFDKGGRELHRAVARLADRYDIRLDIVTDAPPHHKEALTRYMEKHTESWVKWHVPKLSRKTLIEEYYSKADVFAMCSYMEVFGYVFLEAMAAGIPVIGARTYAQREIISDGVTGYLIDVPISPYVGNPQIRTPESVMKYREMILDDRLFDTVVNQLSSRLQQLIEDRRTLSAMSKAALQATSVGKFSLRTQRDQLGRIYEEALAE